MGAARFFQERVSGPLGISVRQLLKQSLDSHSWWRTQSSRTSLRRPKFSDNANPFAVNVFLGGPKRRLFALFIALEHSSLQCVSRS